MQADTVRVTRAADIVAAHRLAGSAAEHLQAEAIVADTPVADTRWLAVAEASTVVEADSTAVGVEPTAAAGTGKLALRNRVGDGCQNWQPFSFWGSMRLCHAMRLCDLCREESRT
jgi:hypothetical protein